MVETHGIRDVLQKGMETLRAQEKEASKEAAPSEDVEVEVEAQENSNPEEKQGEEDVEETDSDSEVSEDKAKEKRRKHSLQDRINQKHAELMQTKEQLLSEKTEKQDLLRRLEALEKGQTKQEVVEDEEFVLEDIDDLSAHLKNLVSKKDLDNLVAKAVHQQLLNAKETYEKQTQEQKIKTLQSEFYSKMNQYYNPSNDPDYYLDADKKEEAVKIMELFNGAPARILDMAKSKGISYIRKFVNGELEAESKAAKVKSIITKADAVKTNMDSNNHVEKFSDNSPPKTWHDLFRTNVKKMKQGG